MRVFLTGASGFVGSHAVRALVEAGHRPRALVRDPAKAVRVLGALGIAAKDIELVRGDMLDAAAVTAALEGCDAAIHAAAALGVTGRAPADLDAVNVTGTRNVVGGAVAAGLSPVVHVSTVAVFVPTSAPVITAETPLAGGRTGYGRSKLAAEQYVRGLQEEGAPVTIVYPGGVCGPDQPTPDALMEGLAAALRVAWPLTAGGVSVLDVRDLAEALARTVTGGKTGERWVLGGHYLTWPQLAALCDAVTGVRSVKIPLPGAVVTGAGAALDAVRRVRPVPYPLTRDAAEFMARLVPTDDRPALDALGLELRPVRETVTDALRFLAASGRLDARHAGRLGGARRPTLVQRGLGPAVRRMAAAPWFRRVGPKVVPPVDRALNRLTGGRFLLSQAMVPSLLLTTRGAVTGQPRRTPLACLPDGDGWLVVGSNFGRAAHPAWTGNLLRHPSALVTWRGRTVPVTARLLDGPERAAAWPRLVAVWPVYDRYVESSGRTLRVFRLSPRR
ncbi:nitroreductase family deazaflavin-dependent oxidoreductase [Actinomadura rayongensis]|uniref:Nitroreductase family deazaflavin-dependent oxidoreductase n=1 Tax=Actinomadura rayongensis TaxID=1429076 RepID=A0A6I4W640_9ACTN|nr:nitroreductase family deazaflavin-dependent oxidoreductase [Actinomadura rayongensis]